MAKLAKTLELAAIVTCPACHKVPERWEFSLAITQSRIYQVKTTGKGAGSEVFAGQRGGIESDDLEDTRALCGDCGEEIIWNNGSPEVDTLIEAFCDEHESREF